MLPRLFLLLCLLGLCCGVRAESVLRDIAVLEDKAGAETIETIAQTDASRFKPLPQGSFAGGFTRSVYWFRFVVDAAPGESWLDILPPVLDDLRLYQPDPVLSGGWWERRSGDTLPFNVRELDYRGFVFKLHHADDAPRTYYLRLQTTSSMVFIPRLLTPETFASRVTVESALLVGSLAIVFAMLLLNINAWIWLRDPLTPWFIAYLLVIGSHAFSVNGFLQQYLAQDMTEGAYAIVASLSFALIMTANAFYRRLFGVGKDRPLLYWSYEANTWLPVGGLLVSLLGYFGEVMPHFLTANIVMTLVGVYLSFEHWRHGKPGALMLLFANCFAIAGILVFILNLRGLLAGGFFVWHSMLFASLGTVLALQIAIGTRFRALRDARVQAERDARHERDERIRQSQFLAMLGHELRTSLSVLKIAVGRQPMSPLAVDSSLRAIDGMSDVVERSIQAEKIADGSLRLERQACDIAELMETVIAESRAPDRVLFEAALCPGLLTDSRLLRVVLANLLDNALKYGADGQPVTVEIEGPGDHPCVRVRNTAGRAGRPDPDKVFDKYYRSDLAHEQIGSGLGLHIARTMAALLDARLNYLPDEPDVVFELQM